GELNHPSGPQVFAKDSYPEVQAEIGRAIARLQTIAKFIDQPYPPQGKGPDYDDAFRYIRREGVKAIAQVRTPAFSLKEGPPTASAAYELLKIANGGQPPVGPPYSLSER